MPTMCPEDKALVFNEESKRTRLLPEETATRRELVRRIVRSTTFARSQRLGSLLQHVCDLSLAGREAELNEHSIGHAVFGRARDYDSAVDGIVRSQASRLRQRLELYFEVEGADEPLRVTVPRGRYIPSFTRVTQLASPATSNTAEPIQPAGSSAVERAELSSPLARRIPWVLSVALGILLLALWSYDRKQLRQSTSVRPTDHLLWSHLFSPGKPTLVVAPDSGLVLFHTHSGQEVDLKAYLDAGYRSETTRPAHVGPNASRMESLIDLANRRYTSIVDVRTILALKDRALALGSDVSMRYARDLRPDDFKTGNAILLGASEADPWVELYEHDLNFLMRDDYKGVFRITNLRPKPDEPLKWESRYDDPQRRVFGVVAYLPSLSGNGSVLLLEGTGMSGAEAGMDFVLDDSALRPFLKQVRRGDGTLPHFELLLETQNIGASAIQSKIVAWRIL